RTALIFEKWRPSYEDDGHLDFSVWYDELYNEFSRYLLNVASMVGGQFYYFPTNSQSPYYEYIPKKIQIKAFDFIKAQLFRTPKWLVDLDIGHRLDAGARNGTIGHLKRVQESVLSFLFRNQILMIESQHLMGS